MTRPRSSYFVMRLAKGKLENIDSLVDFRLRHDVDGGFRVATMCPHSD